MTYLDPREEQGSAAPEWRIEVDQRDLPHDVVLVFDDAVHDEICDALNEVEESAAVLLGTPVVGLATTRFVVSRIRWVPAEAYLERRHDRLSIASSGYVDALSEAEGDGLSALWFHTHPGPESAPLPSIHDAVVDSELRDVFQIRTGSDFYGSVIASPGPGELRFSGYLTTGGGDEPIARLVVVGDRLRVYTSAAPEARPRLRAQVSADPGTASALFSRNIAAFGGGVQGALGILRIAVVGAGGTGSSVAEQLVRLGVRHLLLVDPDALEPSNVTRVYGSTGVDAGRNKVDVLAQYLQRVAPDLVVTTVVGSINHEAVAREAGECDVVFGCTDDNSGRMVLSRLAAYLRVLVIDCGVVLSTDVGGHLSGIDARVTTMKPGAPCLICRGRLDLARAAAEQMSADEHRRLAAEGYAPDLPGVQPAVVAFTTAVAAQAVTELLELLTGFGHPDRPTEVILRIHDREVSTNGGSPKPGHFCDPAQRVVDEAAGVPFLGKMWAS